MIDMARTEYPADLMRAAHAGEVRGQWETFAEDLFDSIRRHARDNPGSALLWAMGIGFVLGWKLKPW